MGKYLKLTNGIPVMTDVGINDVTGLSTEITALNNHISDTSNPHNVTKSQVGLGNVTNDAQLTRGSDDWASFPSKTSLNSSDRILIEDSTSGFAKKKATIADIVTSSASGINGVLRFQVNGPYNVLSSTTGADGIYILNEDVQIVSVRCYVQIAGSSGSTGFNLLYAPPNSTSFSSLFSNIASIGSAAGNYAHIANGESKANMTAPVLVSSPIIIQSGGILRWDITSVQGGSPSGCGIFVYYTK